MMLSVVMTFQVTAENIIQFWQEQQVFLARIHLFNVQQHTHLGNNEFI